MATKKELLEKLDKIDDEELAHMLALVAYRENQEELDQLLQSEEYTPPDEAEMRTFQEKFHKDSHRALHRSKSRIIRWACGVAAAAVFAFAVPISADNVTIFQLVAQVFTDHSDISTLDGYTFEKPAEWDCEYYPTWIPNNFTFSKISKTDYSQSMYFESSDNLLLSFSYIHHWQFDYSAIDQKQFSIHTVSIFNQEHPIYYTNDGSTKIIYIRTSSGTLVISGQLSQEILVTITEKTHGLY